MEVPSSPPTSDRPALNDGELVFCVQRAEGTTEHRLDLLLLKLTCEQCESLHRLEEKDGVLHPTPDFLLDLAGKLQSIGFDRCTPTLAWQAWIAAGNQINRLKKNMSGTPN